MSQGFLEQQQLSRHVVSIRRSYFILGSYVLFSSFDCFLFASFVGCLQLNHSSREHVKFYVVIIFCYNFTVKFTHAVELQVSCLVQVAVWYSEQRQLTMILTVSYWSVSMTNHLHMTTCTTQRSTTVHWVSPRATWRRSIGRTIQAPSRRVWQGRPLLCHATVGCAMLSSHASSSCL